MCHEALGNAQPLSQLSEVVSGRWTLPLLMDPCPFQILLDRLMLEKGGHLKSFNPDVLSGVLQIPTCLQDEPLDLLAHVPILLHLAGSAGEGAAIHY